MEHKPYNGYWNYETWAVSLSIDNDDALLTEWTERAAVAEDTYDLADELKADFEQAKDEMVEKMPSWAHDLFTSAMDEVNWVEIAEELIKTAKEG